MIQKQYDHLPYASLTGRILDCCFEVMNELGLDLEYKRVHCPYDPAAAGDPAREADPVLCIQEDIAKIIFEIYVRGLRTCSEMP